MQRRVLAEALAHAFPNRAKLAQMLVGLIDETEIPHGEDHQEVVYKLVRKMDGQGRIGELVMSAILANPGNPKMNTLLQDITQSPIPVTGTIVRGEQSIVFREPPEGWDMDFLRRLDDMSAQMSDLKTTIALANQSRELSILADKERRQLLDKEIEALRESSRNVRQEIVAIKEWQKAQQNQLSAFEEWRAAVTVAREMRYPQSYVRFAIGAVAFLVLATSIAFYLAVWGVPTWLSG